MTNLTEKFNKAIEAIKTEQMEFIDAGHADDLSVTSTTKILYTFNAGIEILKWLISNQDKLDMEIWEEALVDEIVDVVTSNISVSEWLDEYNERRSIVSDMEINIF